MVWCEKGRRLGMVGVVACWFLGLARAGGGMGGGREDGNDMRKLMDGGVMGGGDTVWSDDVCRFDV